MMGLALLMGLGGCATGTTTGAAQSSLPPAAASATEVGPSPAGPPSPRAGECASIYSGATVASLTAEDTLSEVTVCGFPAGATEVKTVTISSADSQELLDSLAGLLAEPSRVRDPQLVCTAEVRTVEDFVVTNGAGSVVAAVVPTDECGKPSLGVTKLLEQMLEL